MKAEITLRGRPITKKNSQQLIGGVKPRLIQSKQYRAYEEACLWQLSTYRGPRFAGPITVRVEYWMPDKRSRPDLVSLLQATSDILEKAKIIDNDRNIISYDGSRIMGVGAARVDIWIEEAAA